MYPALLTALMFTLGLFGAPEQGSQAATAGERVLSTVHVPWSDASAAVSTWRDSLPESLSGLTALELESRWPAWVRQRDRDIRARLGRGDEDWVVNLWLYGTRFTRWPRAVEGEISQLERGITLDALLAGRLEDLLDGLANPG